MFYEYAAKTKAYMFYDLNANVIIELNDVEFYEYKFTFKLRNSGGTESKHILMIRSIKSNNEVETKIQ